MDMCDKENAEFAFMLSTGFTLTFFLLKFSLKW